MIRDASTKAVREGLAISGWLLAQRPHPVGRWPAKRLAKMGDRGLSKIGKAKQCLVRRFAHLSDSLQAGLGARTIR
jgi:hypothetical protein